MLENRQIILYNGQVSNLSKKTLFHAINKYYSPETYYLNSQINESSVDSFIQIININKHDCTYSEVRSCFEYIWEIFLQEKKFSTFSLYGDVLGHPQTFDFIIKTDEIKIGLEITEICSAASRVEKKSKKAKDEAFDRGMFILLISNYLNLVQILHV